MLPPDRTWPPHQTEVGPRCRAAWIESTPAHQRKLGIVTGDLIKMADQQVRPTLLYTDLWLRKGQQLL